MQPDAKRQRAKLLLKTFTSVLAFDIFKMNLILRARRAMVARSASMTGTKLVGKLGNIMGSLCSSEVPVWRGEIALSETYFRI